MPSPQVPPKPVDAMLVTGTDDLEGLEKLADMAGEALGAEYPLVGVPMVLEDGK